MLDAHLDESNDAASRKPHRRLEIVNWINNHVKAHLKIIDFGCGPGLYAYEFGKLGHNVLGVDFNKESINFAQKHKRINDLVEYKYCNYLTDTINGKFNLAVNIFCHFVALTPDEQKLFLKKLHGLLEDDGIYVFDVFGKEEIVKKEEYKRWHISNGGDFWSNEPYFMYGGNENI